MAVVPYSGSGTRAVVQYEYSYSSSGTRAVVLIVTLGKSETYKETSSGTRTINGTRAVVLEQWYEYSYSYEGPGGSSYRTHTTQAKDTLPGGRYWTFVFVLSPLSISYEFAGARLAFRKAADLQQSSRSVSRYTVGCQPLELSPEKAMID